MTEQFQFALRYDGDALRDHEMDARDLAPALIGLCDLIDEANRIVNDGRARIDVRVRTLKDGSFQIDVALVQSILDQAVDLLSGKHVTALIALAAILGLAKGSCASLIELTRRLKGLAPHAVKEVDKGKFEIQLDDNSTIHIRKETLLIYQSKKARRSVHNIVKPLEREGIDSAEILHDGNVIDTIRKTDAKLFEPSFEQTVRTTERRTMLRIQALWFRGDNKWRFMEGENSIAASIDDQRFIERILKEDEPFQPSDLLEVILRVTETTTQDGDAKADYSIAEVLNHIKSPKQGILNI